MKKRKLYHIAMLYGVVGLMLTSCDIIHKTSESTNIAPTFSSENKVSTTPAHEHIYGEWIEVTQPTEDKKGLQKRICSICGYEDEKEMDLLPHTHKYEEKWSYDETKHWHASTCGHDVNDAEIEHIFVDGICSVCGYVKREPTKGLDYRLSNDNYYIVSGLGSAIDFDIVIPDTYNGLPVKKIGNYAFKSCNSLISIKIPNSVTSIDFCAFSFCGITNIELPNSITNIENGAFSGCNLTSIVIPKSVEYIGESAFSGCNSLTSIIVDKNNTIYDSRNNCNAIIETSTNTLIQGCNTTIIPNSVTNIGNSAFSGCNLTSIEIPNSVIKIGDSAFSGCYLTNIEIPNSVTSIGIGSFSGCLNLKNIEIPNSVRNIGEDAFNGCSSLLSIKIPSSVTIIEEEVFSYCTNLSSVEIPISVISIEDRAFIETGLTNIKIPNSVISIGDSAFSGCNLTSIVIPKSVEYIGDSVFSGCNSMTSIMVDKNNTIYDSRNNCNAIIETSTNTLIQGCNATIIPDSVTNIGESAFKNCKTLTNIKIPNSVIKIGASAFFGCLNLMSIEIPDSVTSIGYCAFSSSGLRYIKIPNSVAYIDKRAFSFCHGLTNIIIPKNIISIGEKAFYTCYNLDTIFYAGIVEDWENVSKDSAEITNDKLAFYSETQPTDTSYKYWHYVDDVPTLWDENN